MDSILVYHSISAPAEPMPGNSDISPARFEQQLHWLARSGRVVRLQDTLNPTNKSSIALTFDDGYRDNLTVALPLLERFNLPMTLFVVAGFVDSDGYLSEEELREISKHPLITIGSHGLWHRHFTRLSPDEARFELTESKRLIEETIGQPIDFVAWPYGECDAEVERLAGECGYRAAWSVWKGNNGRYSRWRVPLGRNDHMIRFIAKASGLYGLTEARFHRFQEQRRNRLSRVSAGNSVADRRSTEFTRLNASISRPEVLK